MKIIILGRGNAGCLSAMHFAHFRHFTNQKVEIQLIYDSKIKPVPTGQGTTLDFPLSLYHSFGSNYYSSLPFTFKTGIMYENWSKKNKKLFHQFPLGKYGLHFNPEDFQNYVCKNLKINFIVKDENIKDYNSLDGDYIIDCRGKPKNFKNYDKLINPLNCALLAELPKKQNDVKWTRCVATPDGWCFYIPLPAKTSVGYLYNNKITSEKKAKSNFKKLFGVKKINHVFPFKQYLAKSPIIDKRVLLNGNKLFFLEPLEATAMGAYLETAKYHYSYIFENLSQDKTEAGIKEHIYKVQNFILYHYSNYSIYKNKFWRHSKNLWEKTNTKSLDNEIEEAKKMSEVDYEKTYSSFYEYGQWHKTSIKQWFDNIAS